MKWWGRVVWGHTFEFQFCTPQHKDNSMGTNQPTDRRTDWRRREWTIYKKKKWRFIIFNQVFVVVELEEEEEEANPISRNVWEQGTSHTHTLRRWLKNGGRLLFLDCPSNLVFLSFFFFSLSTSDSPFFLLFIEVVLFSMLRFGDGDEVGVVAFSCFPLGFLFFFFINIFSCLRVRDTTYIVLHPAAAAAKALDDARALLSPSFSFHLLLLLLLLWVLYIHIHVASA